MREDSLMLQANSSLWSPCNGVTTTENWVGNLLTNFGKLWIILTILKLFQWGRIYHHLKGFCDIILLFREKRKWYMGAWYSVLNSERQSCTIGKIWQKLWSHLLDNGPLWLWIGFWLVCKPWVRSRTVGLNPVTRH